MPLTDSFERAAALASTQYGLVSVTQLRECGISRDQRTLLTQTSRLVRVALGVYRFAGTPDQANTPLMQLVLLSGGTASHRSAASLLGLIDWLPQPEVTVARLANFRAEGRIHRHQDLEVQDIAHVQGIPCTNATRVLIDIGAVRRDLVEPLFHAVLHRRLAEYDDIVARFYQVARKGRNGVGPLRAVLAEYDSAMAPGESTLEVRLLEIIRQHGIKPPVRQHRVTVGGKQYRLDVAYPDEMLAIEGDGFGVHSERDRFETDRERQNALVLLGWRPLRFTWRQIRQNSAYVANTIRTALRGTG
jgi:very-short-patch-repair endonuclease